MAGAKTCAHSAHPVCCSADKLDCWTRTAEGLGSGHSAGFILKGGCGGCAPQIRNKWRKDFEDALNLKLKL